LEIQYRQVTFVTKDGEIHRCKMRIEENNGERRYIIKFKDKVAELDDMGWSLLFIWRKPHKDIALITNSKTALLWHLARQIKRGDRLPCEIGEQLKKELIKYLKAQCVGRLKI